MCQLDLDGDAYAGRVNLQMNPARTALHRSSSVSMLRFSPRGSERAHGSNAVAYDALLNAQMLTW
jgi:hypothetical protein